MTYKQLINVFIDDLCAEYDAWLQAHYKPSQIKIRIDCIIKRLEKINAEAEDKKEFQFDDGKDH